MSRGKIVGVLIISALAFFILGYFRNYVFLTVNDRASAIYYNSPSPPLTGILTVFSTYDYNSLVTAKWILTFLFTVLFGGLSTLVIYACFGAKKYIYLCLSLYALVFIISLLFSLSGKLFLAFAHHGFNISRSLAHLEQSPIIIIVMVAAIYYSNSITQKT